MKTFNKKTEQQLNQHIDNVIGVIKERILKAQILIDKHNEITNRRPQLSVHYKETNEVLNNDIEFYNQLITIFELIKKL